jgi:hypothetical protein
MQEESKTTPYRVHTPLVAFTNENDGRTEFVAIPRGSIMVVLRKLGSTCLVDVECDGKRLSVFSRDIEQCTDKIAGSNEVAEAQRHGP